MESKQPDALDAILRATTAAELEAWETSIGIHDELATLDSAVGTYLTRIIRGETPEQLLGPAAILAQRYAHSDGDVPRTIYLAGLSAEERAVIEQWFAPSAIERRGTWSLPRPLELPTANQIAFVALTQDLGRYAPLHHMMNHLDTAVDQQSPDTIVLWCVVTPLIKHLFFPYRMRTWEAGRLDPNTLRLRWHTVESLLIALGVDDRKWFTALAPGSGWHRRSDPEQETVLASYIAGLQAAATPMWGRRFRLWCMRDVYTAYARRAKAGTPTRSATIRRRNLEAFTFAFGGDWLRLLRPIEATPSPQERIVTDSPTPRIVAGTEGVLSRIVWNDYDGVSPMETRALALRAFWQTYDALWATALTPGPSLPQNNAYTLLRQLRETIRISDGNSSLAVTLFWNDGLSPMALPSDVRTQINTLWGSVCLSTAPIYQVSNPFPLNPALDILRPIVEFWKHLFEHCVSETSSSGVRWSSQPLILPEWIQEYLRDYPALQQAWMSPELGLIRQNIAELGDWHTIQVPGEATPQRWRPGFESLRDRLTTMRRAWADEHLDAYIARRWRVDLETAAASIHALEASLNRQPKPQAVGQKTRAIVDRWMNGALPDLYRALALPMPSVPLVQRRLPDDRVAWGQRFANALVAAIGLPIPHTAEGLERWRVAIGELLASTLFAVQLLEARGEAIMLRQVRDSLQRSFTRLGWPEERALQSFTTALHLSLG